jgi:Ca2+-binding RTX toxin-like protein
MSAFLPAFVPLASTIAGAGDVLLVSNSNITEVFNDAAPDIVANTLILSASTGVGTAGNALETQVGTIEAETTTGGINITNYGAVVIGGLTDNVNGLDVETSGDLFFTNFGTITAGDLSPGGFESIHGGNTSGNVSLIANGFSSDILSNVDNDFIAAPGGNILLQAGRDVSLGTGGANFDNDVRARGSLTVLAGRDVNVDGFADLSSDGFGAATGGNAVVTAGRDINILNSTGTDASIGAEGSGGGDAILTTGPGGFLRLLATSSSTLFSSTGDVTVNADRVVISGVSGITASSGIVTLAPATAGWAVNLGSATDGAFALEISDAELDRIFTPNLAIGSNSAGPATVSAAISPASAANLVIRSGTNINVNASVSTTSSLSLSALDNVFQLAASTITAPGGVSVFVDAVNDDPNVGGIATLNGVIVGLNVINGNSDSDTLNGNAAQNFMFGFGGSDTLRGFGGDDRLDGGALADRMIGGLGNDWAYVDDPSDVVTEAVGEGYDRVYASTSYFLPAGAEIEEFQTTNFLGTDTIHLTGNSVSHYIFGNQGFNRLDGGGGADFLTGYGGPDWYFVDNAGDVVTEAVGEGYDRVYTSVSYTLTAGAEIEEMHTSDIAGTAAIQLNGNGFSQYLFGNAGNNRLDGGAGSDILTAYGGADEFLFANALGPSNVDTVADFQPGVDKLLLENGVFIGLPAGALAAGAFRSGTSAQDADDRIIYDPATGNLYFDADGNGAGAQVQFAVLTGTPVIGAGDFLVI